LKKILASAHFSSSKRYPALLQYIVENTLEGKSDLLKERTLGVDVFDRPPAYDTNTDTLFDTPPVKSESAFRSTITNLASPLKSEFHFRRAPMFRNSCRNRKSLKSRKLIWSLLQLPARTVTSPWRLLAKRAKQSQ